MMFCCIPPQTKIIRQGRSLRGNRHCKPSSPTLRSGNIVITLCPCRIFCISSGRKRQLFRGKFFWLIFWISTRTQLFYSKELTARKGLETCVYVQLVVEAKLAACWIIGDNQLLVIIIINHNRWSFWKLYPLQSMQEVKQLLGQLSNWSLLLALTAHND